MAHNFARRMPDLGYHFIKPKNSDEEIKVPPILDLGNANPVFWCDDMLISCLMCRVQGGGKVSAEPWVPHINAINSHMIAHQVVDNSGPYTEALSMYLTGMSVDEALEAVDELCLSPSEINAIMASAPPSQRPKIMSIFSGAESVTTIEYKNKIVKQTSSGWYIGDDLISDAVIYLASVAPDGDDVVISGTVAIHDHTFEFTEKMKVLQKGRDWLVPFVVSNGGPMPLVADRWRRDLLAIAMRFHRPSTQSEEGSARWSPKHDRLIMPNFIVHPTGIEPRTELNFDLSAPCAGVMAPSQMMDDDINVLSEDVDFWVIAIYVFAKLVDVWYERQMCGLVLSGDHADSWMNGIQSGLNLRRVNTASIAQSSHLESNSVVPVLVDMLGGKSQESWLSAESHNAITVATSTGAAIMKMFGWAQYKVGKKPSSVAIRNLSQVFNALCSVMPGVRIPPDKAIYRVIGNYLGKWFSEQGGSTHAIDAAASCLTSHELQGSSFAARVVYTLRQLSVLDEIDVIEDKSSRFCEVNWDSVELCGERNGITMPDYDKVRRELSKRGYLYKTQAKRDCDTLFITYSDWLLSTALS